MIGMEDKSVRNGRGRRCVRWGSLWGGSGEEKEEDGIKGESWVGMGEGWKGIEEKRRCGEKMNKG